MPYPYSEYSDEDLSNRIPGFAGPIQASMITELQRRQVVKLHEHILTLKDITEKSAASSQKLTEQTDKLITHLDNIGSLAKEQKTLAERLEKRTDTLIKLTWGIVWLSIGLLAIAIVTLVAMFFHG